MYAYGIRGENHRREFGDDSGFAEVFPAIISSFSSSTPVYVCIYVRAYADYEYSGYTESSTHGLILICFMDDNSNAVIVP